MRYPIFALFIAGAAIWLALRRPFTVAVEGESMSPTLRPGDYLIATRSGRIDRGALLVVEHAAKPGYEMVKRLAGVPGDSIGGRRLGSDEFWLLGDNPPASTDSRSMGTLDRSAIRGVILFRYWPPDRMGPVPSSSSIRHLWSPSI